MNKGIPYLLSALVALTLSADGVAPVMALFEYAYQCLQTGSAPGVAWLRCPSVTAFVQSGAFMATALGVAVGAAAVTRPWPGRHARSRRVHPD